MQSSRTSPIALVIFGAVTAPSDAWVQRLSSRRAHRSGFVWASD